MKGTLTRLGIQGFSPTLRKAVERLTALWSPEGEALPPNTVAELRRDMERLHFVRAQIKEIEQARLERLQAAPEQGTHPMVLGLSANFVYGDHAAA